MKDKFNIKHDILICKKNVKKNQKKLKKVVDIESYI